MAEGSIMIKEDSLGNRMKSNYEKATRLYLPRRTHTIIRLDGKAFHTVTKNMRRPCDSSFVEIMSKTAKSMCQQIQGVEFAYTQSDEISLLLTDYRRITSQAWFDNNLQKICSVSASLAAYYFSKHALDYKDLPLPADIPVVFDSRVFTIADPIEVENYFIWRQQDIARNSLQLVARSHYSHKEVHGKNTTELHNMIHKKGDNWNDYAIPFKRGIIIEKNTNGFGINTNIPIFTKNTDYLQELIPERED